MLISIYGADLGPDKGCVGQADTRRRANFRDPLIYPTELCGVQVFAGDLPAGLLYVQEKQINFQVPQGIALGGTAEIKVVYQGQSSSTVRLPVELGTVTLSVDGVARVGGPVWIKIADALEGESVLQKGDGRVCPGAVPGAEGR